MGRDRAVAAAGGAVGAASLQDRDGAPPLLASVGAAFPGLRHVVADGACAGRKLDGALRKIGRRRLEIVRRPDAASGFALPPRRWAVERSSAWLGRNRRLAVEF